MYLNLRGLAKPLAACVRSVGTIFEKYKKSKKTSIFLRGKDWFCFLMMPNAYGVVFRQKVD
jgi:hypothetical protein